MSTDTKIHTGRLIAGHSLRGIKAHPDYESEDDRKARVEQTPAQRSCINGLHCRHFIYLLVCFAQLRFRQLGHVERTAGSRIWFYPYLTWLTALAIVAVLSSMAFVKGLASQLYASLLCCALVVLAFYGTRRARTS